MDLNQRIVKLRKELSASTKELNNACIKVSQLNKGINKLDEILEDHKINCDKAGVAINKRKTLGRVVSMSEQIPVETNLLVSNSQHTKMWAGDKRVCNYFMIQKTN